MPKKDNFSCYPSSGQGKISLSQLNISTGSVEVKFGLLNL